MIKYIIYYIDYYIDIVISKLAIWSIRRGYGANCETKDTVDFPEMSKDTPGRCASCVAEEIIEWFEERIKLIKGKW